MCSLLERNEILNRSQLAEVVCEQLGFHDARGQKQLGGCLKELRKLETAGHCAFGGGNEPFSDSPQRAMLQSGIQGFEHEHGSLARRF